MEIKKIIAREILDSRGNPTVEVDLHTNSFITRASVPSGASTGIHEALELRDNDTRYKGKGVLKAVENINKIIAPKLIGLDVEQQKFIDTLMINLDGTKNKQKLGANAILAVSMAVCRAGAMSKNIPLFKHIHYLAETKNIVMPNPYFNVINGGVHAGNKIDFQEYMIVPFVKDFKEALRIGSEVYHTLKKILKEKYGLDAVNVGDEGGFAPPIKNNEEPLKILMQAIKESGYENQVKIALDPAASEFYYKGYYLYGSKFLDEKEKEKLVKSKGITGEELANYYLKLITRYPIVSIEDGFSQDDWKSWQYFMNLIEKEKQNPKSKINHSFHLIGDDLLVTNVERIKIALEKNACNGLLLKINQIGTITEAIKAAKLALGNGWLVMVSHRSGETDDPFIADLVVGLGAAHIKSGSPCRGERLAKYNQLLRIEEELENKN
ncbi:MAG: phosphopyruvate hydratase [Candidatus Woesearchaeota archaeon]